VDLDFDWDFLAFAFALTSPAARSTGTPWPPRCPVSRNAFPGGYAGPRASRSATRRESARMFSSAPLVS